MTIIKFFSKLVNRGGEYSGNISMNNLNESFIKNNSNNDSSNINYNCKNNNQPQPSPSQPTTQFNTEPHDFFEEIKREDDSRLMSYSL